MIPNIILWAFFLVAAVLVRRDVAARKDVSRAIWIPTWWVAILASRPVSFWLGGWGSGDSTLEGNYVDAAGFFILIVLSCATVYRRRVSLGVVLANNAAIFFFYGYFLFSVIWAEHPVSSLKRWVKDIGDVAVALVVLTEVDPSEAIKAVFVRCAYVLIPLSYIYVRWFPDLGRRYNIHSGALEAIGVCQQKNSLGAMILVCGLAIVFDVTDRQFESPPGKRRRDILTRLAILGIGLYLLNLCDSKTSMTCLALGSALLLGSAVPFLRKRMAMLGSAILTVFVLGTLFDSLFGIKEAALETLGRDATLTGRTDVWRELLNLHTNPIFGTGFCSIWDSHYRALLPDWVAFSAHDGYLEVYLDGGWIGLVMLAIMLVAVLVRATRQLADGTRFAVYRYAVVIITIFYNVSESIYGRLSPGWFLFLFAAVNYPMPAWAAAEDDSHELEPEEEQILPSYSPS
jgi:exopolysaccharide production protein ExoQ